MPHSNSHDLYKEAHVRLSFPLPIHSSIPTLQPEIRPRPTIPSFDEKHPVVQEEGPVQEILDEASAAKVVHERGYIVNNRDADGFVHELESSHRMWLRRPKSSLSN